MATSTPPKLLRDGLLSLLGGMNSGIDPMLLPLNAAAMLHNVMVRGGFAETRFGLKERGLTFENEEQQAWFEDNLFQGAGFFAPTEKTPMFIASVGGRLFKIDVLNGYRVSEITPVGGTTVAAALQDVAWTNLVGVTLTGTTLTKTAADGWGNAGAFSTQSIAAGNGYVEFSPDQLNGHIMVGFGDATDAGQNYPELTHALFMDVAGDLFVYESGVQIAALGPYALSDVLRIEVNNGVVTYKVNGAIEYTSAVPAPYPIHVDMAMHYLGTTISDIKIRSLFVMSPPIGSSVTIPVADTTNIHIGYPVIIGSGRYTVTAKTLTTITATNIDARPGVSISFDTPIYYLLPNMSLIPKTWMLQAETYFIIQNGVDGAIIYDGATARRAIRNGLKLEVPTGTAMAYWQGRIWVATRKFNIEAGDINSPLAVPPTTIIDFTENLYLNEGGPFRVPTHAGEITALVVLPVLDQSLGQGALQVHTKTSISTINVPPQRAMWKDITNPIQTIALIGFGATSDKSALPVNMDLFFRGTDGLRSFRMARQEQGGTWANTPISKEIVRILKNDSPQFLQYVSATHFENLLLFTVNPFPFNSGRAAYWRGLGVLDFDPISAMGQKSPPVYAGLWSGVNVMQILTGTFQGKDRCFLFVRNAENKNELWEIDPQSRHDGDGGKIQCRIESRGMAFGSDKLHDLQSCLLRIDNLQGEADFRLQFRRSSSNCWMDWGPEQTRCATVRQCASDIEPGTCFTPAALRPGYDTKIGFGQPPNGNCDDFDKTPARVGASHEIALEFDGAVRIKMLRLKAYETSEPENPDC